MILNDALRAVGQLPDPRFRRVLALGVGLTLALFLICYVGGFALLRWLLPDSLTLPWIGELTWLDEAGAGLGLAALLLASVFLMVPVASLFTGLFLDRVADAVEAAHYPSAPAPRRQPLVQQLGESVGFLGVLLAANLAALVAYVLLAPLAPLIFYALNGFLLGREYFQLTALRHLPPDAAARLRRRHLPQIWLLGALMAVPLTIPLVNLTVPVLGAAAFAHLFHRVHSPE
ncbi:MAG: EI24 domain-containing protein [Hasllibacter sp.]